MILVSLAVRSFRFGEGLGDITDLLVGINMVYPFVHRVEGGNHPESDSNSRLVKCFCFWLDLETDEVNLEEILIIIGYDCPFCLCLSVDYIVSQKRMHGYLVKEGLNCPQKRIAACQLIWSTLSDLRFIDWVLYSQSINRQMQTTKIILHNHSQSIQFRWFDQSSYTWSLIYGSIFGPQNLSSQLSKNSTA
jgi:hypothetical protein